ncbi:MAG: bifunctional nuclease family protein, partial [Acidobacteria bacterium]|nr:bifunctional nuclease family protein [Acidobacteriota bacterium]
TVIRELSYTLTEVVVTGLDSGTFFAELHLEKEGEDTVIVSARPSDAIALATRMGASVSVAQAVLDEAGIEIRSDDEDAEDEIKRFREFLDDLSPDDFGESHSPPEQE